MTLGRAPRRASPAEAGQARVVPVILAAGAPGALPFPQALGRFGRQTAIGIAVRNAARIGPPLVVLGAQAALVRPAVPRRARVVLNRAWRAGQIASLRAGLRRVPPGMALMLYPVDFPLLTERLLLRLVRVYEQRKPGKLIVAPQFRGRGGHPVIFAPELRAELASALSLREVVYRDPARVQYVPERTAAIRADFDTMSAYRLRRRQFRAR